MWYIVFQLLVFLKKILRRKEIFLFSPRLSIFQTLHYWELGILPRFVCLITSSFKVSPPSYVTKQKPCLHFLEDPSPLTMLNARNKNCTQGLAISVSIMLRDTHCARGFYHVLWNGNGNFQNRTALEITHISQCMWLAHQVIQRSTKNPKQLTQGCALLHKFYLYWAQVIAPQFYPQFIVKPPATMATPRKR